MNALLLVEDTVVISFFTAVMVGLATAVTVLWRAYLNKDK